MNSILVKRSIMISFDDGDYLASNRIGFEGNSRIVACGYVYPARIAYDIRRMAALFGIGRDGIGECSAGGDDEVAVFLGGGEGDGAVVIG